MLDVSARARRVIAIASLAVAGAILFGAGVVLAIGATIGLLRVAFDDAPDS